MVTFAHCCTVLSHVQEPYYKKSDGGGRLGYWNTTEAAIEADIAELEALVQMARSARAASPAAVSVADDALAAASWALKAFRLFMSGGGGGAAGVWKASGGGEGVARGRKGLPAFAELSALLEMAVRAQQEIPSKRASSRSVGVFLTFFRRNLETTSKRVEPSVFMLGDDHSAGGWLLL